MAVWWVTVSLMVLVRGLTSIAPREEGNACDDQGLSQAGNCRTSNNGIMSAGASTGGLHRPLGRLRHQGWPTGRAKRGKAAKRKMSPDGFALVVQTGGYVWSGIIAHPVHSRSETDHI